MDLVAATQRIEWLDEERRRDHAEIARLTQEMASALAVLRDQSVQMRDTGNRLAGIESGLAVIPHLQDAITAARSEILPLHDADIRLEDEIQRQAKDRLAQADQASRVASEFSARIELLNKSVDGLAQHLQVLDEQRKDHAERQSDIVTRLDGLMKAVDSLAGRISLQETREKDRTSREGAIPAQIDHPRGVRDPNAVRPKASQHPPSQFVAHRELAGIALPKRLSRGGTVRSFTVHISIQYVNIGRTCTRPIPRL